MMDPYFEHYTLCIDNDRPVETCSISVTPTTLLFDGTVQKKSFYIQSNTDWVVSVPTNSWLTVSDYYGSNNGLIYVNVIENLGAPRNLNITISGCATKPPVYDWYELLECDTLETSYSQQYAENTFSLDDRVTYGDATFTIADILHTAPSGTLIPITDTGLTGCPGVTFDWYTLYRCSDGEVFNSQSYAEGTFSLSDRVTSSGVIYVIDGIINYNPGGTLLPITTTGLTGCPTYTTYYELSECAPGVGYAYTAIAPGGVGQRYVLPYPTATFYTYTGATVFDTVPPSGYNASIQITVLYGCP
jgi:hypothetical protein